MKQELEESVVPDYFEEEVVPGTVHLVDSSISSAADSIVLFPQPSADPEDPLNWSRARKWLNISLVFFYCFTTGIGGTSVYSVLVPISDATGITVGQLVNGTGYLFLLAGWSNLVWQPLALTFGRRPVFLASMLGCLAMSEWAAHIGSSGQWAACRCLFGVFVAPVEVLPELCVAELFYAHERGGWMGIYMLVLASSNYIAPLIAGFMNQSLGWQWVQHWCAIVLGLNFVLAFFFYEDTMYNRKTMEGESSDADKSQLLTLHTERSFSPEYHRQTFLEKMRLYRVNEMVAGKDFFAMMWRPVYMFFAFPIMAWCGFFYGLALAWYSVYNATGSEILSSAPYNFSSSAVGLSYIAPLIGALIGGALSGPIADKCTLLLARRNRGVREPEQRLWGLIVYNLLMPGGLILWGVGAFHEIHWIGLMFSAAITGICNVLGGSYALSYLVDSYKDLSGEALVTAILCRNTIAFAFNYAITPWINSMGLQNAFIVAAVLAQVTGLTFLLLIWKGKSLRRRGAKLYYKLAASQVVGSAH
jgi:MFS family permease